MQIFSALFRQNMQNCNQNHIQHLRCCGHSRNRIRSGSGPGLHRSSQSRGPRPRCIRGSGSRCDCYSRFRNRPSDGSAVGVHYPSANGDVKTMYIGTKQLKKGCRVLIVDDFMRGGSTAAGMLLMARQFDAEVVGVGIFIASEEPKTKAVPEYRSLLTLSHENGTGKLKVTA